jgi:putative spermidine/putrescine transport system permease protein
MRRARKWVALGCHAAVVLLVAAFVLGPLLGILGASVSSVNFWDFPPRGLTLDWYRAFLADPQLVASAYLSVSTGLAAALLGTLVGLLSAVAIARNRLHPRVNRIFEVATLVPLLIPTITLGLAIYIIYLSANVPINFATLGAAQLVLVLPLITNLIVIALRSTSPNVERSAANLGSGPIATLWRVTVPGIRSTLIAAAILAFTRSFDDASVALFVNTPHALTLPVRMVIAMEQDSGPLIAASGSVLLLLTLAAVVVLERTVGLDRALGIARSTR